MGPAILVTEMDPTIFSYFKRNKKKRTKQETRKRNPAVSFDESGLPSVYEGGSEYYVMVATVIYNTNKFDCITSEFPVKKRNETKYRGSTEATRRRVLSKAAGCDINIYFLKEDKRNVKLDTAEQKRELHISMFKDLLSEALFKEHGNVYDIIIDSNSMISKMHEERFVSMCYDVAEGLGKEIHWVQMVHSKGNATVQVNDFIAATIGASEANAGDPEHGSHALRKMISGRIKNDCP